MMGSPYYYDVLFDDGPGDVVFHDCMWSGICTCCIQLLHQDSYYQLANESPDLKVEDLNQQQCRTQSALDEPDLGQSYHQQDGTNNTSSTTTTLDPRIMRSTQSQQQAGANTITTNEPYQRSLAGAPRRPHSPNNLKYDINSTPIEKLHQRHDSYSNNRANQYTSTNGSRTMPASATAISPNSHLDQLNNHPHKINGRFLDPNNASDLNTVVVGSASSSRNSPDNSNPSSLSSTISSAPSSTSTSPKPLRRREHNDSERKRRDHLRNAFNFLRDQVPRFKQMNKKPPRIQILHEATKYVQCIMRESQELERRLEEERARHVRLQQRTNQ